MSKYVLTVVFENKLNSGGITSQVYNLHTRREAETIVNDLDKSLRMSFYISSSIACIDKDVLNAKQDS